jgi:hypothetical protein
MDARSAPADLDTAFTALILAQTTVGSIAHELVHKAALFLDALVAGRRATRSGCSMRPWRSVPPIRRPAATRSKGWAPRTARVRNGAENNPAETEPSKAAQRPSQGAAKPS